MQYKVKEIAEIAGVSIRTLHYYDKIDLLKPKSISPSGYRLYSNHDLENLQQILFFKELGFSLQETKKIINSPDFDRKKALINHKELLIKKKERIEEIILSVVKTIQSIEGGPKMNNNEMFNAFDISDIEKCREKYKEETKQKYRHTRAYRESQKKTAEYTKKDWDRVMGLGNEIYKKAASLMNKEPADPQVEKVVGELRQYITDNFYNCTIEIFRGLGNLYVNDKRFTKNIDKYKPGLAKFLREAILIYCDKEISKQKK